MNTLLLISNMVLWMALLGTGFLLLGTLRSLGLLTWRLHQLEVTTPRRLGREGLAVGKKAPDFTLASAAGGEGSLRDFAGRKVLLVFMQSGCGPCMEIVPELNRVHDKGEHQVLVVNNGDLETTRTWAAENRAHFPVFSQEKFSISKRYHVFATPYAFVIGQDGLIASKGIAGSRQYLRYVLTGAGNRKDQHHDEPQPDGTENGETKDHLSPSEATHA
jgi:methylamine dehydrogenase accessory protein MauD